MAKQKLQLDNFGGEWITEQFQKNPMPFFTFLAGLLEPRFSIGQIGISRQELQYWRKNDLIKLPDTGETRTWVKVSFFDYCWLKLVAEMRALFIPIEHIKLIKEELFSSDVAALREQSMPEFERLKASGETHNLTLEVIQDIEDDPESYEEALKFTSYFVCILVDLIRKNNPASLVIDRNGMSNLIFLNEQFTHDRLPEIISLFDDSFTAIRLNNLLDEFYKNPRIKETHIQAIFRLTDKETKILELLRKKGVKEVRVRLGDKGKGIVMVEVVEEKNINSVKEKIRAILDKEKVQNIRISSFEGNLLLFEETTKMKL